MVPSTHRPVLAWTGAVLSRAACGGPGLSAVSRWGKPKVDGAEGAPNGVTNGHAVSAFEAGPADVPPMAWDSVVPPAMAWPADGGGPTPWTDAPAFPPAAADHPPMTADGVPMPAPPDAYVPPTDYYAPDEWMVDNHGWKIQPRSAIEVLNTLTEKVSRGEVGEY